MPDAGTRDAGAVDSGPITAPPDGGRGDGGTPNPDGGSADGGNVDAGSPDGGPGTDGGVLSCRPTPEPPVASCDALMPTQPLDPPRRFLGPAPLSSPDDPVCLTGAFSGDKNGLLGVMRTLAEDQNRRVSELELELLSPDGTLLRSPPEDTNAFFLTVPLPEDRESSVSMETPRGPWSGWMGRERPPSWRWGWRAPRRRCPVEGPWWPRAARYTLDGRVLTAPLRITRRDDAGTTLWSTPIPASIVPDPIDAQVYPNGNDHVFAVVALDAFQVRIVWLDEQGEIANSGDTQGIFSSRAAAGPSLELPDHALAFSISPAHSAQGWVVVHDLDPALDVPPCWLNQRRETRVLPIRGSRGYAVFHGSTFLGDEPRQGLEIVHLERRVVRMGRCDLRRPDAGSLRPVLRDGRDGWNAVPERRQPAISRGVSHRVLAGPSPLTPGRARAVTSPRNRMRRRRQDEPAA